ncbi:MAG: DUF58 domain-containing protein [Spirochaetaceae bacterium]|jgi:hypothetical protein|nr:DUF58 domain-containing protein [Spirochaetaceae bacterium]
MSGLKKLLRYYPLTLLGSFMMAASLLLLSLSILRQQPLGSYVAVIGLLSPVLSALGAYLLRNHFSVENLQWNFSAHLTAGSEIPWFRIDFQGNNPLFYRLHISFKGGLWAGNDLLYRCFWSRPLEKGQWMEAPGLPASGELKLKVRYSVGDLLGLSRWSLPQSRDLEWAVFSAPLDIHDPLPPLLSDSEEDQRAVKKEEWERIFTREYVQGDLARDINWKASVRIGKLITRIPPESLGESPQMQIFFRSPQGNQGRLSLFHLEHLKALLTGFLKQQLRMDTNRSFQIFLNREIFEFKGEGELQGFLKELAQLGFSSSLTDYPLPEKGRESCIFVSFMDQELPRQLKGLDRRSLYLYVSTLASPDNPGLSYSLINDWPVFFPKGRWLKAGDYHKISLPRTLGHLKEFPLKGGL